MIEPSNVLCRSKQKSSVNIKIVAVVFILLLFGFRVNCDAHDPLEPKWTKTELTALLKKSADYYKKLQNAPIHYFCHQEITETINTFPTYQHYRERKKYISELQKTTRLRYDYQIMKKQDFRKEVRILVERNGKKVRVQQLRLKTRFPRITPSLKTPLAVISAERQAYYRFKLLERFNDKRGEILVLEARPHKKNLKNYNYSKVWLLGTTGAVVRMETDEKQVPGHHKLVMPFSRSSFSIPSLKVNYYFDVFHKGLHYPSKAEITESFTGGADFMQKFEDGRFLRFTGTFLFKDYHFFNIEVEPQGLLP